MIYCDEGCLLDALVGEARRVEEHLGTALVAVILVVGNTLHGRSFDVFADGRHTEDALRPLLGDVAPARLE